MSGHILEHDFRASRDPGFKTHHYPFLKKNITYLAHGNELSLSAHDDCIEDIIK